jgi:hypothetical protein
MGNNDTNLIFDFNSKLAELKNQIESLKEIKKNGLGNIRTIYDYLRNDIDVFFESNIENLKKMSHQLMNELDTHETDAIHEFEIQLNSNDYELDKIINHSERLKTKCHIIEKIFPQNELNHLMQQNQLRNKIKSIENQCQLLKIEHGKLDSIRLNLKYLKFIRKWKKITSKITSVFDWDTFNKNNEKYELVKKCELKKIDLSDSFPLFDRMYGCRVLKLQNNTYFILHKSIADDFVHMSLFNSEFKLIKLNSRAENEQNQGYIAGFSKFNNLVVINTYLIRNSATNKQSHLSIIDGTSLTIVKQINCDECVCKSICANEVKIVILRHDQNLEIYNWQLDYIGSISCQTLDSNEPFFLPLFTKQIEIIDDNYVIKYNSIEDDNNEFLNIINEKNGILKKSIFINGQLTDDTFFLDYSKKRIIFSVRCVNNKEQEGEATTFKGFIKCINLEGQMLNEYELESESEFKSLSLIDESSNSRLVFIDTNNLFIYLYSID